MSIDDNISQIDRLVRYIKSSIGLQRLVHAKMIADVSTSVGFETTRERVIPLLSDLSIDPEPAVRQHMVEQLSPLAKVMNTILVNKILYLSRQLLLSQFCVDAGLDDGYRVMIDFILPLTSQLLEDEKIEVILSYFLKGKNKKQLQKRKIILLCLKVRQAACNTLVDISKLVKSDELGQYVLTVVLVCMLLPNC